MHEDASGCKPVAYFVEVQVKLIQNRWLSHEVTLATGERTLFVIVVPMLLENHGHISLSPLTLQLSLWGTQRSYHRGNSSL